MPQAISLGIGEPDFVTPWKIREASIFALEKGKTSYTDNRGLLSLRKEISRYVSSFFGPEYDPSSEILVTVGVSEAIDVALRSLLNPGDKVLYHEPCYVSYAPSVTLAFGEAIPVATSPEHSFALDPDAFEQAWQPGCKVLMLNFPTNPTGGTADLEKLERLAKIRGGKGPDRHQRRNLCRAHLRREARQPGFASRNEGTDSFAARVFQSFCHDWLSGRFCLWSRLADRCNDEDSPVLHDVRSHSQPRSGHRALARGSDEVERMKEQYFRRRNFVVRRFNEMGLPCHLPRGSFYAFPSVENTGLNEVDFCHRLLREKEVAVVPGTAFGPHGQNHVRASFSTSYEKLVEATDRMELFLETVASENKQQDVG